MIRHEMVNQPLAIAVADHHAMFRREMRKIIEELPDVAVIGEVADREELLRLLAQRTIDLLLLDVSLPAAKPLQTIALIKEHYPEVRVLLMVMGEEREYQDRAVAAGAYGVLLKQDAATECSRAIERIRRGKIYFPGNANGDIPGSAPRMGKSDLLSILSICF
jgi:DNA-binding NarL/FixJ family response regulator